MPAFSFWERSFFKYIYIQYPELQNIQALLSIKPAIPVRFQNCSDAVIAVLLSLEGFTVDETCKFFKFDDDC